MPSAITPIPFDPRRFQGAAQHYHARPPYSPRLFRWLAEECALGPDDRVMDLGCGPGVIAIGMAPYVGTVVGVDPEPEMLRRARAATDAAGLDDKISFIEGSSNDLGPSFGSFTMVTMGRSFHWMDRVETLRRLETIMRPGGMIVLFNSSPLRSAWQREYRDVLARYTGDAQGEGRHWRGANWVEHEEVLLDSAFSGLSRIEVIERNELPAEALVDRAFSMSRTAPNVLGPEKSAALAADLRALAARIAVDGVIGETLESGALIARRP